MIVVNDWMTFLLERTERLENGCLVSHRTRNEWGYAQIGYKGKVLGAHRLMFMLSFPEQDISKLNVNHHCDNPPCIEITHLYAGTNQDNSDDRERRGRGARVVGSGHPRAKLNEEEVVKLRLRYKNGESSPKLAAHYGMNHSTILDAIHGKTWKHVE